jgi:hypothetical protein
MSINPYSPPTADVDHTPDSDTFPALWSPGVAAALAFFFSPFFGALIVMKNWEAMGEHDKARQSKMWAIGTIVFYALMIVSAFMLPETTPDLLFRAAGIGFFIAWYMVNCKDQKDVVEYRYGKGYPKRSWTKAILIAVGIYLALLVLVVLVVTALFSDVGLSGNG